MTEYLNCAEAAEIIRMDINYVQRQCKAGAIRAKKLGTQWRITRSALEEFMSGERVAPPTRERRSARQKRRSLAASP